VLAAWFFGAHVGAGEPVLTIVLRYDDWCPSGGASAAEADVHRRFLEVVTSLGVPMTVAYIPAPRAADGSSGFAVAGRGDPLIEVLRRAAAEGRVEVALHGLHHLGRSVRFCGTVVKSEFAGFSVDEQARMIRDGLRMMEEAGFQRVRTFVPPYNTHDRATYLACARHGIRVLSADRRGPVPEAEWGVFPVPLTCEWAQFSGVLATSVEFAERGGAGGALVVVGLHWFDFKESGSPRAVTSLREFRHVLARIRGDRRVEVTTFARLAEVAPDTLTAGRYRSDQRFRRCMHWLDRLNLVPERLLPDRRYLDAYWPAWRYASLNRRVFVLAGSVIAVLVVVGTIAGMGAWALAQGRRVALVAGAVVVVGIGALVALRCKSGGLVLFAALFGGFVLGMALAALALRRPAGPAPRDEQRSRVG